MASALQLTSLHISLQLSLKNCPPKTRHRVFIYVAVMHNNKIHTFLRWKRYSTIGIPPVSGFFHDTINSYADPPNGSEVITSGLGTPEYNSSDELTQNYSSLVTIKYNKDSKYINITALTLQAIKHERYSKKQKLQFHKDRSGMTLNTMVLLLPADKLKLNQHKQFCIIRASRWVLKTVRPTYIIHTVAAKTPCTIWTFCYSNLPKLIPLK